MTVVANGNALNVSQRYTNHFNLTLTHLHLAYAANASTPRGVLSLMDLPVLSIFVNTTGFNAVDPNLEITPDMGLSQQVFANDLRSPLADMPLECLLDCITVAPSNTGGCCPDSSEAGFPPGLPLVGVYVASHYKVGNIIDEEFSAGWLQVLG
jgi:hypothetical protein